MPLFVLYAPDYTDDEAIIRRLAVREKHLIAAKEYPGFRDGGALLSPSDAFDTPNAKMIGSVGIVDCVDYAAARNMIESDVYWTNNVWDKEKTIVYPFRPVYPSK